MTAPLESAATAGFAGSRARFETVLGWLESAEAGTLEHAELEAHLQADARELFRQLYQDHLDLRAEREPRIAAVADAEGVGHGSAEPGHTRGLATVFGPVQVTRIAYRARGQANLHPADGGLNLRRRPVLPRAASARGDRGCPRLVRRRGRGDRAGDGTTGRQAPGGGARPASGRITTPLPSQESTSASPVEPAGGCRPE